MLISSHSRYSKTGGLWDPSDDCCRPRCTLDRPCGQGEVNLVVLVVMLVAPIVCGGDGQMLSEPRRTYFLSIKVAYAKYQNIWKVDGPIYNYSPNITQGPCLQGQHQSCQAVGNAPGRINGGMQCTATCTDRSSSSSSSSSSSLGPGRPSAGRA